ncbi:hypothetical protein K488DRAFT_79283 [Vararia minispora EC-137]|uniref:Uncharacterized protein n=1 Tax=Vararia minispora EC-137 TaxID=1314806 RepID=A0ACB8QGU3_9AGAM|nr:hypothetical protein K488DRAFT_79283 [Vararia minispora EC-137]
MANETPLTRGFPSLSHLTREDVEDLLSDQAYFDAIFHSLPQVKDLYQAQAELGKANESIASDNLSLQSELYKLRSDTKVVFDEAKALEARWAELQREQRDLYQRYTPQFLLLRLRHATTAQDDLSEALASSFIRSGAQTNGKDVDDFVREFRDARKVYHKRAMWGDRWTAGEVHWNED